MVYLPCILLLGHGPACRRFLTGHPPGQATGEDRRTHSVPGLLQLWPDQPASAAANG